MAMQSALCFVSLNNIVHRLLDAQVNHLVAVIRQNDIHEVLTNIMDIL